MALNLLGDQLLNGLASLAGPKGGAGLRAVSMLPCLVARLKACSSLAVGWGMNGRLARVARCGCLA